MSISKAFRVLTIVLAAVLAPATALAGTTATPAPAKVAHGKLSRAKATMKNNKAAKSNKATKGKAQKARPKLRVKPQH